MNTELNNMDWLDFCQKPIIEESDLLYLSALMLMINNDVMSSKFRQSIPDNIEIFSIEIIPIKYLVNVKYSFVYSWTIMSCRFWVQFL